MQKHYFSDLLVDAVSPVSPRFWRRASTFCKAPLKKSTSRVFSANSRFSWLTSLRSVDSRGFSGGGSCRCQQGPVDRVICTTAADERPAPPTALRCSRNASVARPPFDETRSDTVPFVSSPLAVPFPAKCAISVCLKLGVQSTLECQSVPKWDTLPFGDVPAFRCTASMLPRGPGH